MVSRYLFSYFNSFFLTPERLCFHGSLTDIEFLSDFLVAQEVVKDHLPQLPALFIDQTEDPIENRHFFFVFKDIERTFVLERLQIIS